MNTIEQYKEEKITLILKLINNLKNDCLTNNVCPCASEYIKNVTDFVESQNLSKTCCLGSNYERLIICNVCDTKNKIFCDHDQHLTTENLIFENMVKNNISNLKKGFNSIFIKNTELIRPGSFFKEIVGIDNKNFSFHYSKKFSAQGKNDSFVSIESFDENFCQDFINYNFDPLNFGHFIVERISFYQKEFKRKNDKYLSLQISCEDSYFHDSIYDINVPINENNEYDDTLPIEIHFLDGFREI